MGSRAAESSAPHGAEAGRWKDFECDTEFDWEPVELLEDGDDVVKGRGSGNDSGCRVLDQLELMEGFVRDTKEE